VSLEGPAKDVSGDGGAEVGIRPEFVSIASGDTGGR
jgi:glycerol transport system ATP-binding protein